MEANFGSTTATTFTGDDTTGMSDEFNRMGKRSGYGQITERAGGNFVDRTVTGFNRMQGRRR
jgi:hypothetical protein